MPCSRIKHRGLQEGLKCLPLKAVHREIMLMGIFFALVRRDLLLVYRSANDAWLVLIFFVIAVTLFPLGIGPDPKVLQQLSGGIIWICALLSAMLSLDRVFQSDFDDGSLDQMILTSYPLELLVFGKCLVHWLTTGFPILLISPLLAAMLNMTIESYPILLITMPRRVPTPRLFEQRLVVVEQRPLRLHKVGGDAGEAAAVEGRGTTFPSSSSSASDAASGQNCAHRL